jgi:hypothetical protein
LLCKEETYEQEGNRIYFFFSFYSAFFAVGPQKTGLFGAPASACGCVALRAPSNPLRPSGFPRLRRINFSQQKKMQEP